MPLLVVQVYISRTGCTYQVDSSRVYSKFCKRVTCYNDWCLTFKRFPGGSECLSLAAVYDKIANQSRTWQSSAQHSRLHFSLRLVITSLLVDCSLLDPYSQACSSSPGHDDQVPGSECIC